MNHTIFCVASNTFYFINGWYGFHFWIFKLDGVIGKGIDKAGVDGITI